MHRLSLCVVVFALAASPESAAAQPSNGDQPVEPPASPFEPGPVEAAPMAPEPAAEGLASVGYKKGFFIESADGKFMLAIQGRVQGLFALVNEKVTDATGESSRENATAFSIARARLTLAGHAFGENVAYKFQSDFGKGNVTLKDFYVDYKMGTPILRVGQFKRPFSRQQINSSGRLEFVDRAITDKAFGAGRDIGLAVHNNFEKSPEIEWALGVFNGTGDKPVFDAEVDPVTGEVDGGFSNVPGDVQPAVVARFGYNQGGIKGYSEADLEGGPLRFGVAGSVIAAFDNDGDDASGIAGELDAIVKSNGLSASGGVYVASAQDGSGFSDQRYSQVGFHLQAGYLTGGVFQPAVRYALVAPDGETASHEVTAAFSVYQFGHGLKWQSDVSLLGTSGGIADEIRARTQLQLSF